METCSETEVLSKEADFCVMENGVALYNIHMPSVETMRQASVVSLFAAPFCVWL